MFRKLRANIYDLDGVLSEIELKVQVLELNEKRELKRNKEEKKELVNIANENQQVKSIRNLFIFSLFKRKLMGI